MSKADLPCTQTPSTTPNMTPRRRWLLALVPILVLGAIPGTGSRAEAANWRNLTGRTAPDLVFAETGNGLPAGTRLSSFRGKQVVLLAFWLRDCPHCKREMPKIETLHRRYGQLGLTVISIVHQFTPTQVLPVMAQRGWTFPVARDPTGQLATLYGGGRRPGYYVIGTDGRVKSSNLLNEKVILAELGRWRLDEWGAVPAELNKARDLVRADKYGSALREAESVAGRPKPSAEVLAAVARLKEIAGRRLQYWADRANAWAAAGHRTRAAEEFRLIVRTFEGTSLEARAKALQEQFLAGKGR